MRHLWRDVAYSLRSLARTPALTATIVLTVGVGLGATSAMIGVVRAVLVNPLPYAAPDNLFWIYTDSPPIPLPVLGRGLSRARSRSSGVQRGGRVPEQQRDGLGRRSRGARDGEVRHGILFPASGPDGRGRPALRRRRTISAAIGVAVLTKAYWARRFGERSVRARARHHARRHEPHHRRRAAVRPPVRSSATSRCSPPPAGPPPRRKGPFFTMVLGRLRPGVSQTAATRHAARDDRRGCFRSGSRPVRTRRRRGACWISRLASSATSAPRCSSRWRPSAACS